MTRWRLWLLVCLLLGVAMQPGSAQITMGEGASVGATSGGGGGVGVFGSPVAGQPTIWHDGASLEGASSAHVNIDGPVATTTEYVTTGATGVSRTLPAAASGSATREYVFIKEDSGAAGMSIAPNGTNTINGLNA